MTHEDKAAQEIINHINADKDGYTWNGRIKSALTTYRTQVLEEEKKKRLGKECSSSQGTYFIKDQHL